MCILSVYTLLKVVGYYDLSVLSMSVMGFKKKSLDGGWVGGVSSIQVFFDFLNFAKVKKVDFEMTTKCRYSICRFKVIRERGPKYK